MRRAGIGVLALMAALGGQSAAGAAGCAPAVQDPARVLATSSRLTGAVAALERLDVGVAIAVRPSAQDPILAASCAERVGRLEATVLVDLHGQPLSASIRGGGSVPQQLAQQAEREMNTRLRANPADASSAVAHGLELVWQEEDQRDGVASPRQGEAGDATAVAIRTLPSAASVRLANRVMLLLAAGLVAGAVMVGGRLVARRRFLHHLRARAQVCRSDLAERYVDLDSRLATIVTTIDQGAGSMDVDEATRALNLAAERKATVEAAALEAGAALLATAADLQHASKAEAAAVADRCAGALAELEEAVAELSRSPIDAGGTPGAPASIAAARGPDRWSVEAAR